MRSAATRPEKERTLRLISRHVRPRVAPHRAHQPAPKVQYTQEGHDTRHGVERVTPTIPYPSMTTTAGPTHPAVPNTPVRLAAMS